MPAFTLSIPAGRERSLKTNYQWRTMISQTSFCGLEDAGTCWPPKAYHGCMRREDVLILTGHSRIVAILRGELNGREIEIAEALAAGGVSALEVSIVSPNYATAITNLARHMGNRIAVGAGTVITVEQL